MFKTLTAALAIGLAFGTAASACTADDVQERQGALLTAMQMLVAVDPAKAQAIVVQMQADLDQAAADGNDAATCAIMDTALATARGE